MGQNYIYRHLIAMKYQFSRRRPICRRPDPVCDGHREDQMLSASLSFDQRGFWSDRLASFGACCHQLKRKK